MPLTLSFDRLHGSRQADKYCCSSLFVKIKDCVEILFGAYNYNNASYLRFMHCPFTKLPSIAFYRRFWLKDG